LAPLGAWDSAEVPCLIPKSCLSDLSQICIRVFPSETVFDGMSQQGWIWSDELSTAWTSVLATVRM
jgi:hypothetical protein